MVFDSMPKHRCDVVARDGTTRISNTQAIFAPTKIILFDPQIVLEVGDEIRRRLPNGADEAFEVLDFHFVDGIHGLPTHYQVTIKRKGTFPHGAGGNFSVTVSGPNSRVNIASHDQSKNVVVEGNVFGTLAAELKSKVEDGAALQKLLAAVEEMKRQHESRQGFATAYQKFISLSAAHMGIIAPFLPALSRFF